MSRPARSVFLSLLVGGVLRVQGLGSESLWLDEANTARRMGLGFRDLFFDTGSASQLPLYFWISKVWCSLAGTGEVALRIPALAFGVLLIPAVFFLGRELMHERAGAWAAFLVAVNPYLLFYSQEARPYTLFALLAVLAWLFLVRWLRTGGTADLAAFWASTAGVLYVHPLGLLILPSHLGVWLLYAPRTGSRPSLPEFRWFWRGMEMVALLFLPLAYRLVRELGLKVEGGESGGAWLTAPGWAAPLHTLERYFMSPWLAAAVLGLALLPALARPPRPTRERPLLLFGVAVWAAFTGIPWLVSQTFTPVYHSRYGIPVVPVMLLLAGYGISRLRPAVGWAALVAVLAFTAPPVYDWATKLEKNPVREAFQDLAVRSFPGDLVVRDPGWLNPLMTYYLDPPPGVSAISPYTLEALQEALERASRVWVVTRNDGYLGVAERLQSGEEPGWRRVSTQALHLDPRMNPRALVAEDITVSLFQRTDPPSVPQ